MKKKLFYLILNSWFFRYKRIEFYLSLLEYINRRAELGGKHSFLCHYYKNWAWYTSRLRPILFLSAEIDWKELKEIKNNLYSVYIPSYTKQYGFNCEFSGFDSNTDRIEFIKECLSKLNVKIEE